MSLCVEDYACPAGHRFESFETRGRVPARKRCSCGKYASRAICGQKIVIVRSSATRGKSDPHPPWALMTDPDVPKHKREAHNAKRRKLLSGNDKYRPA